MNSTQPEDGFKPGDRVSLRGVVENGLRSPMQTAVMLVTGLGHTAALYFDPSAVTFIERPAPPEPDWRPGDLAEDDEHEAYVLRPGYSNETAWWRIRDGVRFDRDEIPGPLYPLTVTRKDAPE